MLSHVDTWGNSLGVRIKKSYAEQLGWAPGTQITETVEDGKLVIAAAKKPKLTLSQMLDMVTPENYEGEVQTGHEVGNEIW
jgi:antitoxin MazE